MLFDPKWEVETKPSTKEVLIEARKLITDPNDWHQGAYTCDGRMCSLAAIWTAMGMTINEALRLDSSVPAERALEEAMGGAFVGHFNDERTHDQVLAAFDRAIAAAQ